jgi:Arylsulfotransferase (ASST)/Repeat of unknown function (DUF346)
MALTTAAMCLSYSPKAVDALGPSDQVNVPVGGSPLANLTTTPALSPAFSQSTHDYVLTCRQGANGVTMQLTASQGGSLQVGNQSGPSLSFGVVLGEGQAAVVKAKDSSQQVVAYWIRCLPHDFPQMQVSRSGNAPDGYYLTGTVTSNSAGTTGTYAMVLDRNGTPVWYQPAPGAAINVERIASNTIAWAPALGPGVGADPNGAYGLHQLDTQTTQSVKAGAPLPTDSHELLPMSNGHYMLFATPLKSGVNLPPSLSDANGTIVDCVAEEVDGQGRVFWSWTASDHISVSEFTRAVIVSYNGQKVADVYHCNSIDVDSAGNALLSLRHEDAVYLVNRTNGALMWKLGGNVAPQQGSYMPLTGSNKFFAQHDARFQANGNISLYDDHSGQNASARGIEYAISPQAGTASVAWQYQAPGSVPAACTGSFRRYSDNRDPQHPQTDNLIGWGCRPGSGFTEVNTAGDVLMNVNFPNNEFEYRVVKESPAALDINLLRATAGQPRPISPATSWQPLGGVLMSKPAAASWASNRLDAFVQGSDNQMWHIWWTGGQWSSWEPLSGVLTSGPGAVSWSPGRVDVFVRGTDQQLWHKWWDGSQWGGWEPLGGVLSSAPAVASWSANRLDVVVEGSDQQVWHKWWDGTQWGGWEPLGGQTTSDLGATSWGPGRLDIFIRNPDGTLNHRWWDGGQWSGWEWFAGSLTSGPAAASAKAGQLDVAAVGADNVPQRMEWAPGWQNWQSLAGLSQQTPAIVGRDASDEDVFVTGVDSGLYITSLPSAPGVARIRNSIPPKRADAEKL